MAGFADNMALFSRRPARHSCPHQPGSTALPGCSLRLRVTLVPEFYPKALALRPYSAFPFHPLWRPFPPNCTGPATGFPCCCAYGVHQATHQRGRVSTKVRHEPVHLTLAVPDNDARLVWAADARKRQAAHVVFRNAK